MKALNVLVVEDDALIGMLFADLLAAMATTFAQIEATEAGAVAAAARYKTGSDDSRCAAARWKRRLSGRGNTPRWMGPARVRQWQDFRDTGDETGRQLQSKSRFVTRTSIGPSNAHSLPHRPESTVPPALRN